jgi:hypothetical protein
VPCLAYVDTDPVFTQLKLVRGQLDFHKLVDAHDVHFSYGERASSPLPDTGHRWLPTRAPVVLSEWSVDAPARDVFTTVMNWTSHNPVEYRGVSYGQKDQEFGAYMDLPRRAAPAVLELAMGSLYAPARHRPAGRDPRRGDAVAAPAEHRHGRPLPGASPPPPTTATRSATPPATSRTPSGSPSGRSRCRSRPGSPTRTSRTSSQPSPGRCATSLGHPTPSLG